MVTVVERGAWLLVPAVDEDLDDIAVAEGGGEVEIGVAEAWWGGIRVVEQRWMRVQDAGDEGRVADVDCASEADRRLDPGCVSVRGRDRMGEMRTWWATKHDVEGVCAREPCEVMVRVCCLLTLLLRLIVAMTPWGHVGWMP